MLTSINEFVEKTINDYLGEILNKEKVETLFYAYKKNGSFVGFCEILGNEEETQLAIRVNGEALQVSVYSPHEEGYSDISVWLGSETGEVYEKALKLWTLLKNNHPKAHLITYDCTADFK